MANVNGAINTMINPTPERIEAAAEAIYNHERLIAPSGLHWPTWSELRGGTVAEARKKWALAALVAAAGATPQEPGGINLFRDLGYDESDPAVIAARAGVAAEHQEAGEPHDCTGVAMIGELESLKQLLDAQRQRGDFWERRYKETAQVDEAKLAEVLVRGLTYSTGLDAETNNAIAAVQANDAAEWLRGGGQ